MDSIRALHVAADEAREALKIARIEWVKANTHAAQMAYSAAMEAKTTAEDALWNESQEIDRAAASYHHAGDATVAQYDRLIAAALACHSTDKERDT